MLSFVLPGFSALLGALASDGAARSAMRRGPQRPDAHPGPGLGTGGLGRGRGEGREGARTDGRAGAAKGAGWGGLTVPGVD